MKNRTAAIPEGFHSLTPYLVIKGASQAIEFYKKAFGAQEISRMAGPDGKIIVHADLLIGNSHLFLHDEMPEMGSFGPQNPGNSPISLFVYVDDVDAAFKQAVEAGAQVSQPLADMFWGDRWGVIIDPFGHTWSLATRKENLTPEEVRQRAQAAFCQPAASVA